jgi:DNA replication protein DnaC
MTTVAQNCAVCSDTGWKVIEEEGKRRVTPCDCRRRSRSDRLLEQASIPRRYEHCELCNFDHDGPQASLASAYLSAQRFVAEYPLDRDATGLLVIGPIGVGKTHLAVAILKELVKKGTQCLFYDYRELLKEIQNSYNASVNTTEMEVLRPIFEAEVLVLDELGAVKPTEWVWDTVSHILNTRYNDKRTTLITTNFKDLPPSRNTGDGESERSRAFRAAREETLGDRIGERMRSRLHEMCRVVEVQGGDYRQNMRSASWR